MGERAVRKRREPLGARNMAFMVFHESRDTKHESRPFIACFDRRVVRNAGKRYPRVIRGKPHAFRANGSAVRLSGRLMNHGVSVVEV